jgi:hypothetical protein
MIFSLTRLEKGMSSIKYGLRRFCDRKGLGWRNGAVNIALLNIKVICARTYIENTCYISQTIRNIYLTNVKGLNLNKCIVM